MVQPQSAEAKKLNIYFWHGHEVKAGYLKNPRFTMLLKRITRGHHLIIDIEPSKERLLGMMAWADIIYGSVHAGFSKRMGRHIIQTGSSSASFAVYGLTAQELLAWRRRVGDRAVPSLMIFGGCNVMSRPPGGRRLLTIYQALGFGGAGPGDKAMLGWAQLIASVRSERITRLLLAHWMRARRNGTWRGVKQALEDAMAFAVRWEQRYAPHADRDTFNVHRNPDYQMRVWHFINKSDDLLAKKAVILGNPNLSFPQIR